MRDQHNPLLEKGKNGHSIGKNPLNIDENLFLEAGHKDEPIAKVIRKHCLECCNDQKGEVRKCVFTDCPLWPHRMGRNPFRSAKAKRAGKGFAQSSEAEKPNKTKI